ncbi:MAG TPA: polysaccharide biosynthesis C-terminal domain-containing protein [Terriglobia bacterium]|nr:polysaccharide biosynthesis C-terminal domain-containing protein [Terriglobia bacterium]
MSVSESNIEVVANSSARDPKFRDAALLTVSQFARLGLRLIFMLAAARALGPDRFGVYVLVLAVLEMVAVAGGAGFVDFLTRETAKDEGLGWRAGIQLILLRSSYAAPLAMAALGVLWLLGYPGAVLSWAAVMFATLIPRAASECVQGVLRGVCRYGSFLLIDLTVGVVLVAGGGWLLVRGSGGVSFVVGTELMAAIAAAMLALTFLVVTGKAQRKWLSWRGLVTKTLVFNYYPLATTMYDRIDVVLLSKLAGDFATGIYGLAYRALSALRLIPYGVLFSILPSLSRDTWGAAEKQRLERAMGLLLSVGYLAVLGTVAFAGPAVDMLLGPRYAGSALAIEILIWAIVPMYINFALNTGLLATSREKVFTSTSSVCLAVNLISNLVLIPFFSWKGAAAATLVTEATLLLQNIFWIRKTMGSVPVPSHAVRTTFAFLVLLAALLVGGHFAPPLLVGTMCVLAFLAYLYQAQALCQFAATWRQERGSPA